MSGKMNPYLLGETDPTPPGSGEAKSIPQPSGETEPTLKAPGETETSPEPSGEAEPPQRRRARRSLSLGPRARPSPPQRRRARRSSSLGPRARPSLPQRRRARQNRTPVARTRDETAPLCVRKFFTFGGYWSHLLGYPGIRSPTVAPEPPGDSSRTAWRVFFDFVEVTLPEGARERTRWVEPPSPWVIRVESPGGLHRSLRG